MFCDILSSFHEIMKLQNPEFDVGDVSPANGRNVLPVLLLVVLLFCVFIFLLTVRRKNFLQR